MAPNFHTETFANIPREKRDRILAAAAEVFGRDGVAGARMAEISRLAGISHGSLFSYFPSKDHLVRALILLGIGLQGTLFEDVADKGFSDALDSVFRRAWTTAEENGSLISLWLSLSQSENERFAPDILNLEREAAEKWSALIEAGYAEGAIEPSLDRHFVGFLVDAAVAQLLKSRVNALEREKFALLYGESDGVASSLAARLAGILAPRG